MRSVAATLARRLAPLGREGAMHVFDLMAERFTVTELAALAADWSFWARPAQLPPLHAWRTWGALAARGWGKTVALSKHVNEEAESGRAMLIGLAAQDEESTIGIQVLGPSGLIATAPPWFKPEWHATQKVVTWPNGARAYVRTPEVPGKIRGLEYSLSWLSELQSWPAVTREEAFDNFLLATRLGYARICFDATPKRRHPILKRLLAESEANPTQHVVVRGTTRENLANLGPGYVQELERRFGNTARAREELLGLMLDDSESALVRAEWIDAARRPAPASYARRVVSIDPAVTARAGSDRSGIIEAGLGHDGQIYVTGDQSGKHAPAKWAQIVLDAYVRGRCDCCVVESNKGGDLVTQTLRAAAKDRGLHVVTLGKTETPRHVPNTVRVREVFARGAKEDRAQPLATAYERGRVSHVIGADLTSLEDILTTWEPTAGQRSPDALDALTHAASELALGAETADPSIGFEGIVDLHARLVAPERTGSDARIEAILRRARGEDVAMAYGGDTGGTI